MKDPSKKTVIRISGMHCPACDILVKKKLESGNIVKVVPNQQKMTLEITHIGNLSLDEINGVLCDYGYRVSSLDESIVNASKIEKVKDSLVYAVLVGAVLYLVNDLKLIPDFVTNPTLGLSNSFILGLIASVSTCMATTGAVLAGYIHLVKNKSKMTTLTVLFLVGRIASYTFFGFLVGAFGGVFSTITQFGGIINIVVASILFVVAFDMLEIISLGTILDMVPGVKLVKSSIAARSTSRSSHFGALLLGISTYFLPCGFSLTTQAYALSTKDPIQSSIIMTAFALGTIPSLFALSFITKIRHTKVYAHAIKVLGVVIFFVGASYILNTATLYGLTLGNSVSSSEKSETLAPIEDGKQIVKMTATSSGYSPNYFVVKKGIPVRWEIFGKEIFGCQGTLQSPKAGIKLAYLKQGDNVFEFVPRETGDIQFSCSMGMFSGTFKVI